MELDNKQKVLLAIYTEYQKDIPDMKRIRKEMNLDSKVFNVAIDKLQNEGLIRGASIFYADDNPRIVLTDNIKMTREGLDYVEAKFEVKRDAPAKSKVRKVIEKLAQAGYNELKDFAAKVLAELMKETM